MENFPYIRPLINKKWKIYASISMYYSYILRWWNIVVATMKYQPEFNSNRGLKWDAEVRLKKVRNVTSPTQNTP